VNVTLSQLKAFERIVRLGSFHAASRELGLSQPSVSQRIRELEEVLGTPVFIRRGPRVSLTAEGHALIEYADRLLATAGEMVERFKTRDPLKGMLRLGLNESFALICLPDLLRRLELRYPGIKISVSTGNSQDVLDRLLDYSADVGVLAQTFGDKRFVSVPYSEHPVVIFCSSTHRFAHRRSIRTAELQGEKLILRELGSTTRKAIEGALKSAKVEAEVVMEVASREIIREAVAQGVGVAAVSEVEYVPGPGLHAVRISDAQVRTYAHVVCLAERRDTRIVRAFFEVIDKNP